MLDDMMIWLGQKLLNQYIHLDPELDKKLSPIKNKLIKFELSSPKLILWVTCYEEQLHISLNSTATPDVIIRASSSALFRQSLTEFNREIKINPEIDISGDLTVIQHLRDVFIKLDPDWEELLSHYVGDYFAKPISLFLKKIKEYLITTKENLYLNTTEYFQDEQKWLVSKVEYEDFLNHVDIIRDKTERIKLRIERLQKQFTTNTIE